MQKKKRIGLFIDYTETEYSQSLIKGAREYVNKKGAELLIFAAGNINSQSKNYGYQRLAVASLINTNNLSGMLFVSSSHSGTTTPEYLESYLRSFSPLPIVTIGSKVGDYPCVIPSTKKSMEQLVTHLVDEHKCRKIGMMVPPEESGEIWERKAIFRKVLEERGLFSEDRILYTQNLTYAAGVTALQDYYKKNPKNSLDAIVAVNDELAFACVDVLYTFGIEVPKKVIVTGFDDEARSACINPSLTTINQNIEKQASEAAKMLFDLIAGEETKRLKKVEASVVYRQSCRCIPLNESKALYKDSKGNLKEAKLKDIGNYETSMWFRNRNSFVNITQIYATLQADISLENMSRGFVSDFVSFGIPAAAVCLFEKPVSTDKFEYLKLPSRAYVFSAYDNASGYSVSFADEKIWFDPNKTLVPELFSDMNDMNILSIYKNTILYGYIMFKPGIYDPSVYGIGVKMFSSCLANANNTSLIREEVESVKAVSMTDELTGLLNRRGVMTFGGEAIETSRRHNISGLVLFGDLDGLKRINDTYGHAAGDRAIKAEAKILRDVFRATDVVGRLGGDEFAIIAPSLTEARFLSTRKELELRCEEFNRNSGEKFKLSISIGYTVFETNEKSSIDAYLDKADLELYKEKREKYQRKIG